MSRLYFVVALTLFCVAFVQNAVDPRPFYHHRPQKSHRPYRAHHRGNDRIVAVGELHSDYDSTSTVLQIAKAIDRRENRIAGCDTFIQTLLQKLRKQAKRVGGEVLNLLGK
ncbi:hypothetical protein KI688_010373 [Linnemannia hyalina]|uniref:Uncharacterized protein n=1 Tax=Linnemannia hyalina TaxID=64524 RepID=A0A9P7XY80_9FUNG|nr:hypothetical protein KI688_010373 [Linnemannia hyalina]